MASGSRYRIYREKDDTLTAEQSPVMSAATCLPLPAMSLSVEAIPPIQPGLQLPGILGNGALIKFTSDGGDVDKVFRFFSDQVRQSPGDA